MSKFKEIMDAISNLLEIESQAGGIIEGVTVFNSSKQLKTKPPVLYVLFDTAEREQGYFSRKEVWGIDCMLVGVEYDSKNSYEGQFKAVDLVEKVRKFLQLNRCLGLDYVISIDAVDFDFNSDVMEIENGFMFSSSSIIRIRFLN